MLKPKQIRKYHEFRRKGVTASLALQWAKTVEPPIYFNGEKTKIDVDGFSVEIESSPDVDGDTSYLGEFTDTWSEEAIERSNVRRGEYKYFLPAESQDSLKDQFSRLGHSKDDSTRLAQEAVQRALNRMEDCGNGWSFIGIIARASWDGVELGSASLWGIESDSGAEYLSETAWELAQEAVSEAIATIERMKQITLSHDRLR
jgi:hypothetical protein